MFLSKGRFGIKLVPLGKISWDMQDFAVEILQQAFRKKVMLFKSQPLPPAAFDKVRNQYSSVKLMEYLRSFKTYKEKIVGIVNEDLFKPDEPFVFSDFDLIREVTVISLWRFEQISSFFDCDTSLLMERIKKEFINKTARIHGFKECENPRCVMAETKTIGDLDNKTDAFCKFCRDIN
ncbi:MAG: archaemetzincin [Firmicutes bacterium]|nr:archaemetzincin [Bacillota bacterium]